jgi:PST family polysaccharide transporter
MLAKAMVKIFIFTEVLFTVLYVVFGFIFVHQFKLVGITFAFALNYLLYFLTMLYIFRKLIFRRNC